ncbi:hypothetical protein KAFR_0C05530 [Kazachstania africana CBS 2517]|uniref:YMC020W-like alpha/beta hydrolase domain-containing protein n=1 Tax=Kazachstania africana (strain ATCC 22294 / BCRC 22015 / CBS 2517 / CECT 1963 / NBRC 1671 / NRRL Y-8276) TaxID=1071382 RepID=H2AT44_KAZAF|nr:hypothetical protein KAFR_0C05530 [Kazachstania africana CBS 2517]CCF57544.1 hypothetical protein KAFR_0C05530 [Kazachstania africana CBS 2517]
MLATLNGTYNSAFLTPRSRMDNNSTHSATLASPRRTRSRGWSLWGMGYPEEAEEDAALQVDQLEDQRESSVSTTDSDTRKRTWSFWSRQRGYTTTNANVDGLQFEVAGPVTLPKTERSTTSLNSPLINLLIPFDPDAMLYRKSTSSKDNKGTATCFTSQEPNIVVPSFEVLPKKSLWTSMTNIFGSSQTPQKHLYRADPIDKLSPILAKNRPLKIMIIGVHGFFPTKVLRTFIGEPTGTSMKFVTEAEEIVSEYFDNIGVDIEISKIALEKEGEIFDRVDFFYNVLKNWSTEINNTDMIYFVTHSQGCPVAIILLAKLIESGVLSLDNLNFVNNMGSKTNSEGVDPLDFLAQNNNNKKKIVSVLGMAGINNGPFYGADQTLLVKAYQTIAKDAMMELFEFQKFDSIQSKKLMQGLRVLIANNVKLTFVGSVNDQLVPLYSSTCLFAAHPNIFRATFIDKSSRTPAFITRIAKIAGTLLNLGFEDHSIIKEISGSLAGPLTGGGHSTIYNEKQVYELGIKFALETSDTLTDIPVTYTPYELSELGTNPYHLPWCMRGLLYETKRHLNDEELKLLYEEFEKWNPDTKQLKDIKYRLNGLKYKL